MGDMADAFRKVRKPQGWECENCGGSGSLVDSITDELSDCPVCAGDGIKPGHPLKDDEENSDV